MGSPIIFNGSFAKTLKANLNLFDSVYILSGSVDPSSVATSAPRGSLYLNTSTGTLYRKTDNGLSTNWSGISGSVSGTNTGDVTLAAVGSSPNANGASLSGQVLNLQPADGSNPGVVTTGSQTFAGTKTFSSQIQGSISGTALNVTGIVDIANGGTNLSTTPTDGQLLIGKTSTNGYALATLTQGSGISISNGSGTISVAMSVPPSTGDLTETSASLNNNQAVSDNIAGFAFGNAFVRSFQAVCSVFIDATTPLYEAFTIVGIQKASSWELTVTAAGDNSGLSFSITSLGQVQYTSASYPGFVSATFKFRAITTSV